MHNTCSKQSESTRCQKGGELWEREEDAQRNVMQRMKEVAEATPIKWVVNVGDNFYFDGVTSTHSDHWSYSFEDMYKDSSLLVPWLSVLGNHDYGGDCCPKDLFGGARKAKGALGFGQGQTQVMPQIDYDSQKDWQWPSKKTCRWVMPYFNWTKTMDLGAYKVQFFGIDTNYADASKLCVRCGGCKNIGKHPEVLKRGCQPEGHAESPPEGQCTCFLRRLWKEQLDWLEASLQASSKDASIAWRFVIGHHPWNFIPREANNGLHRFLKILNTYKVQVYFTGHVHAMRHDLIHPTTHMVMVGSSGGYQYDGGDAPAGDPLGETLWSSRFLDYGFAHFEMTKDHATVKYINDRGDVRQSVSIEATMSFSYEVQPWGRCSDACGQGMYSRELKCRRLFDDQEVPLHVCEEQAKFDKPATTSACFPTSAPAVEFCSSCQDGTSCGKCLSGFQWDGKACRASEEVLTVNYEILIAPGFDWRAELNDEFLALVSNLTRQELSVETYAVYPKGSVAPPQIEELASFRRRLDENIYSATSVIRPSTAGSEAEKLHDILEPITADSSLLPVLSDPTESALQITKFVSVSVLHAPNSPVPSPPSPPASHPSGNLLFMMVVPLAVFLVVAAGIAFVRGRQHHAEARSGTELRQFSSGAADAAAETSM
eukprot:TRINITY_DN31647_c0_g1_i1.p1 TRINITY_DN31647_c0_g1~~TRINITY_DN31647_c0_g1_i1.p1  ORF type:complete len:771 (-),score=110.96 TRINITY_DN31647_c0_g1_i1:105-2072(-)